MNVLMFKQLHAIKTRFGWSNPPRMNLIGDRMHMCPGNIQHALMLDLPKIRKHNLFNRHAGAQYKACTTYWRCHLVDYRRYMSR